MAANSDGIVFTFWEPVARSRFPPLAVDVRSASRRNAMKKTASCLLCGNHHKNRIILIDAGLPELAPYLLPYPTRHILLTHYHMDHVQGLFPMRWGYGEPIPVFGPGRSGLRRSL